MNFGHLTYIIYLVIFTLIPAAIFWAKDFRFLKKNLRVILRICLIAGVYVCIADYFGVKWGTWDYGQDKILGIWVLNFPLEDFLFAVLSSFTVSSAVLSFIHN